MVPLYNINSEAKTEVSDYIKSSLCQPDCTPLCHHPQDLLRSSPVWYRPHVAGLSITSVFDPGNVYISICAVLQQVDTAFTSWGKCLNNVRLSFFSHPHIQEAYLFKFIQGRVCLCACICQLLSLLH